MSSHFLTYVLSYVLAYVLTGIQLNDHIYKNKKLDKINEKYKCY